MFVERKFAMNRLPVYRAQRPSFVRRVARGFTLLELLVVIAILGLLATLVGPKMAEIFGGSKTKIARIQISELDKTVEMFRLDVGRYPTTAEGLQALVAKPPSANGWNGPYMKEVPADPWGNPYHYSNPGPGGGIEILTLGGDNAPGGDGENADVRNTK
jgi:general secretion pathway protein G